MSFERSVHIHLQQRNGKKTVTTVSGLAQDLDLALILKALKDVCKCGGHIVKSESFGKVIQVQGDHRDLIKKFLADEEIVHSNNIHVHGA